MREREKVRGNLLERERECTVEFCEFQFREREGDESKGSAWNCVWVEDEKARKSL